MSWIDRMLPTRWRIFGGSNKKAAADTTWIRGRYILGPEVSSFEPSGTGERWWIAFDKGVSSGPTMDAAWGAGVEVEFSGDVSEPGEFGHMGQYARTFLVRAIRN